MQIGKSDTTLTRDCVGSNPAPSAKNKRLKTRTNMYEFSWYENGKKIHRLIEKEDHNSFWSELNIRLRRREITFPFCLYINHRLLQKVNRG